VSEYLEVRCGPHRFLVPSADVASIEILEGTVVAFSGRRAPRDTMMLDGRILAGSGSAGAPRRGVALRAAGRDRIDTRIVVDQVGALIRCEPHAIEALPLAVARLRPFLSGVWRDQAAGEYLFCVRPRGELPSRSLAWRRLIRRAALVACSPTPERELVP
jgi:hypothetical protein